MRTLIIALSILGYPYAFSQTTITLQPGPTDGKDANISSCIPCGFSITNYGNVSGLSAIAWTNQGANSDEKGLFEFDLSSIPATATIQSAELSLYFNPDDGDGPHSNLTNSNASYLRRIVTPWNELDVTWNTQPSITTVNQVTLAQSTSSTQDYTDIDVTALVQDMINDPSGSHGFLLEGISDQEYHALVFASSDHPNSALRPKLVITYSAEDPHSNVQEVGMIDFQLIPNPASEHVHIASENKVSLVEVFTTQGQLIFSNDHPTESIDISSLCSGSYLVRISTEAGVGVKKLLIE